MGDTGDVAKALTPFANLLERLAGRAFDEMGILLADKARAYRLRNTSAVVEGTGRLLGAADKPVNAVPPRLLLPIIDAASLEDNPTIQALWSGLLASASDKADDLSPSYIETLKQLTPMEARSLKVLYDHSVSFPSETLGDQEQVAMVIMLGLKLSEGERMAPVLITDI